jgi:1,4-alpha-glucan branching enzyme
MPTPSAHSGMGAIPYLGGVAFRVWAPFAQTVCVAGEFNDWSKTAHPLAREHNEYWSVDVPGATSGQKYKYVINTDLWRIDPRAKAVTNSVGDGYIVDANFGWHVNDFRSPPWHEMVIYEMHVKTFPDDPTALKDLFQAVARDLWYLKDLGVNAIHLLPSGEFPGDDSWGYNPAHIYAVESAYGEPDELKALVDAAHEHRIAVIMDVVYNHLGPNDLSVWQFDGWFQRANGEDMGGIYFYNDWRADTPWGKKNRPDYGRGDVRQFIRDNALMWLDEYRMDGLRFDATNYIRNVYGRNDPPEDANNLSGWGWNLMRWINDDIKASQAWKITIAEDMQHNPWVTTETSAGGAGFDSQWDAHFHHTLRGVMTSIRDEERDMWAVKSIIEKPFGENALNRVVYTESHDEVAASNGKRRVPEDIHPGHADSWEAKKRSTLGAGLVFTSPGIPMICQGQEILEWIPFGDQNRLDWEKYDRFRGIFSLYRHLIRLRRNWFNNTRGLRGHHVNVFHVNSQDKVVGFHRWENGGPGDDVVVVANFGNRTYESYSIGFPRQGYWYVRFNSDWNGYSPDFGNHHSYNTTAGWGGRDGMDYFGNVGIGPYSMIILSQ